MNWMFNTVGKGWKDSTFFYLGSDGIRSMVTFERVSKSDERILLQYLKENQTDLLRRYDREIVCTQLGHRVFRVNTATYQAKSFQAAIKRYLKDFDAPGLFP